MSRKQRRRPVKASELEPGDAVTIPGAGLRHVEAVMPIADFLSITVSDVLHFEPEDVVMILDRDRYNTVGNGDSSEAGGEVAY